MKIRLVLANGEEFKPRDSAETGVAVKIALESADNVGFANSEIGEKFVPDSFGPAIDMTPPKLFYRCRIYLGK